MAVDIRSSIGHDLFESRTQISEAADWLSMEFDENLEYCLDMDLCDLGVVDAANALATVGCHSFKVLIRKPKLEPFAFINSTGPEIKTPATRKLVRKYATQSRDTSKKREPSKKKSPLKPTGSDSKSTGELTDEGIYVSSKATSEVLVCRPCLGSISRLGASGVDPFLTYPFETTPRDRCRISHFFDDSKVGVILFRDHFVRFAAEDQAAFHQLLTNVALQMNARNPSAFKSEKYEQHEIVAHHTRALHLVQQRLTDPKAGTSNGTVAAIICMVIHSHIARDFKTWHSHMEGLSQIFKLREDSGPDNMPQGFPLEVRNWLAWIDVAGSSTQDIPPRFPLTTDFLPLDLNPALQPSAPRKDILSTFHPSSFATSLITHLTTRFPTHSNVLSLFTNALYLTMRMKQQLLSPKRDMMKVTIWTCLALHPLMHALLSACNRAPITFEFSSIFAETTRLGVLLFFCQVRKNFGIAPREVVDMYIRKLIPLLDSELWGAGDDEVAVLRLWVMALGAMQANAEGRAVLVAMLRRTVREMGIKSYADAEKKLRDVMWVGEIHGVDFWGLYRGVWM